MQRRQVLCALVVAVALTAGCMNAPRPTPQPPSGDVDAGGGSSVETPAPDRLSVPEFNTRAADDATVVGMKVWNRADRRRGVRVTVSRQIGNRTVAESTDLVLGVNQTKSAEVVFDMPYDRFQDGSGLDFEFSEQPVSS
ncbi:hypothetical protein [Halorientalis sp.]|jgi:hypothetical protein|uniref:hypothetical protein n=1 Tax=Halorientalis sp. TaxID=1931229 RepID=UPI0026117E9A|nr:hypothetical protein [Halorientalis sp.]